MTWYSTGTVKTTASSAVVIGTGTAWTNSGLRPGDMLLIGYSTNPLGYEIKSIDSATQITLVLPFPLTFTGAAYMGIPMLGGDRTAITMAIANQTTKALADTEAMSTVYQTFYTAPGVVTLTLPGGLKVTGSSFSKLTADMADKVSKSADLGAAYGQIRKNGDPATGIGSVYDYSTALMTMSTRGQTPFFPGSGQGTIINIPLANNDKYSSRWIGDSSGRAFFQSFANSVLSDAFEICLVGKSVTVDGNGFIKKSSPIARLSYDPQKMQQDFTDGFKAAGAVSVNEEAEGVTGERIGVGIYRVSGSEGLAKEGWTVEIPQDVNGNRLIFVETEIADNGDITVSTFKRRFDPDSAMIVAGDPMDIPEGRWVDLRLQMPQKLHVVDTVPEEIEQ